MIITKSKWLELWNYLSKNKNLNDFILDKGVFVNNSRDLIIIKNKKKYEKKINLIDDAVWGDYIFKLEKTYESGNDVFDKNNFYVQVDLFSRGLFIRNWHLGDFYIDSKNKKKRVSKLFLKNKFNNYKKMIHPLIVDSNDKILWIPGLVNNLDNTVLSGNNNCIKISKEILN